VRIVLVNPPHTAIGSRIPDDHLPPLGLLSVGGPLLDAGHEVSLLDADFGQAEGPLGLEEIVVQLTRRSPDVVMLGHSGSTSAHPTVLALTARIRRRLPYAWIVYGGVYPTYHWRDVLEEAPQIDVIVRGEGEETAPRLVAALGGDLREVPGLGIRHEGEVVGTGPAPIIRDLDSVRVGWELIDHRRYSYWGGKRAVVVQFSRGCPHTCNYCGQRGFWTRWRHRDPVRFAAELAWLHREHGVEVFNFADENPSAARKPWKRFLEALIAEGVRPTLVGSTRADDIVRDADILHLYKEAGWERFLLGMENTDEETLKLIGKGGTTTKDREAIRLLRQHGILSMATWVVGFQEETPSQLLRGLRQLLSYDPDQIQALYVTPHRWTPFYGLAEERQVIQADQRKWDYKHQVLATRHLTPAQLFAAVKAIEVAVQARPKALRRLFFADRRLRHAQRWYTAMGRRVWFHEVAEFINGTEHLSSGPTLRAFFGASLEAHEESMDATWRRSHRARRLAAK